MSAFNKSQFPYFEQNSGRIYLDTAATAQKPQRVIDALSRFYSLEYATVNRAAYRGSLLASEKVHLVRQKVSELLNSASYEEIVFTKGATESLNLIATSFAKALLMPGDEILVPVTEHHANLLPWQAICQEKGAHLIPIPVFDNGDLDVSFIQKRLSPKVKIIALAHMTNTTGSIYPIKQVSELAHSCGAYCIVDGAQAAPHMPVDVQALGADFYVFSAHKFYGPTGLGFLYGKKELLNRMTPYQYGGDMIETVSFEGSTFRAPPYRLEAGTPMIAEIVAFMAALDFVEEIGLDAIQKWESHLLQYTLKALQDIPNITIIGESKEKGALITLNVQGIHPLDLGSFLDVKGVDVRTGHLCAQPTMKRFGVTAALRVSFGIYNTEEDCDRFIAFLKEGIQFLS